MKNYNKEVAQFSVLTAEEEKELFTKYRASNNTDEITLNKLVNSNLKLVVSVVNNMRNCTVLDYEDMIQEGNLGLVNAINKFDINLNLKFSTYATKVIESYVLDAIHKYNKLHTPSYIYVEHKKMKSCENELESKLGRAPSYKELAKEAGMDVEKVIDIKNAFSKVDSLEKELDENYTLEDVISSNEDTPLEKAFKNDLNNKLYQFIDQLSPKEQFIITSHMGLNCDSKTLEEIAKVLNISRQRVSQIEARALEKLKINLIEYGITGANI